MDTEKMTEGLIARMAENIAPVQNAYEDVIGNHEFSESQLNHFLKFQD